MTAKKTAPAKKTTAKKTTTAKKASTRSGNPAVQAAAMETASVHAFKKRRAGVDLQLPSGLWVKARRVELQAFIASGTVHNPLMAIVSEALDKGQNMSTDMIKDEDGHVDLQAINEMYEMVNSVLQNSWVEPKVHLVPTDEDVVAHNSKVPVEEQVDSPEELRDDDILYVDEVDDEDKMFCFQWCIGGTSDVATFRAEAGADLASLAES